MEVVVIDFETTGLSCHRHRIIEVGCAIVDSSGAILDTFQQLCNPGVKISSFITRFTGITNEMVEGKPTPEEVMMQLHEFIGSRPLVAHNASFDSQFLRAEMSRIGKVISNPFVCTLLLSRRLLQGAVTSFKLSSLKTFIDFKAEKSHCDHRALDDVLVTVHLWNHLINMVSSHLKQKSVDLTVLQSITKMSKKKVQETFPSIFTDDNREDHGEMKPDDFIFDEQDKIYLVDSAKLSLGFFQLELDDNVVRIQYGRVGTSGVLMSKTFKTKEEALKFGTKSVLEKKAMGYKEHYHPFACDSVEVKCAVSSDTVETATSAPAILTQSCRGDPDVDTDRKIESIAVATNPMSLDSTNVVCCADKAISPQSIASLVEVVEVDDEAEQIVQPLKRAKTMPTVKSKAHSKQSTLERFFTM